MHNSDIHMFSLLDKQYIILSRTMAFYRVSLDLSNFIMKLLNENSTASFTSIELEMYQSLLSLINQNSNRCNNEVLSDRIQSIWINITQKCNLGCVYCFAGDGSYGDSKQMPFDIVVKSIEFVISHNILLNNKNKYLSIVFFGGEPLLNFKTIQESIINLKKNYAEINFEYTIVTNGSLINDEIAMFLKKWNIRIQVSLDGGETTHDKYRPFKNQSGSFETIRNNIKTLNKYEVPFVVRETFNKEINTPLSVIEISELSPIKIYGSLCNCSKSDPLYLNPSDLKKISDDIRMMTIENSINTNSKYKLFDLSSNYLQSIKSSKLSTCNCGAGRGMISVDVNGDIYLCSPFIGNSDFKIGDIFTGFNEKRNVYLNDSVELKKECSICWARYQCAGGCYHSNFLLTGDCFTPDEDRCTFLRSLFETHYINYILLREKVLNDHAQ